MTLGSVALVAPLAKADALPPAPPAWSATDVATPAPTLLPDATPAATDAATPLPDATVLPDATPSATDAPTVAPAPTSGPTVPAPAPTADATPSQDPTTPAPAPAPDVYIPAGGWAVGTTDSFTFEEPSILRPTPDCVPIPSKYDVTSTPWFIPSPNEPHAVSLAAGQALTWTTTKPSSFTARPTVGPNDQVQSIVDHARTRMNVPAQMTRSFGAGVAVSTRNGTGRPYTAVVGTTGYSLIYTKTWQTDACTVKVSSGVIVAPGNAGLSFGKLYG